MSGIKDTATVTLNVNGAQAKQMMSDLETKIKATETAIKRMKAAGADAKDVQKAQKQLQTYRKQLDEMRSATEGVSKALTNLDRATPRQLEKALRTLNRQLKDMTPGSAVWQSHINKIQQLQAQLKQLKTQVQGQESLWQRFSKWWFQCGQAVAAVVAGYQMLVTTLRGYVNDFAEMEEQLANTRKFTGMTESQVRDLNEEFKKMDTRTAREQLNLLAQEAGRLGKNTKESVQGYVEAADIINVALVDLGQGATQEIAKLSSIFNVEEVYGTKDAMLKVGSTVNVLSQNCTASKPYIVEFTKRLAGVGAQAKMTVPEIMAFAATLDANGQAVEMSASALSRTIMMLFQKPQEIAKTVGLDVEEFTKTLQKNTTEGLMMFFGALQKMGREDALAALSPMFKDLGMDGVRMSTVLATVANKLDMVKWEMDEANKAFKEGISATREYNIFNNTAQATIEKAKKRIHELSVELGEKLYPLMAHLTSTGSAALKVLNVTVDFIIRFRGVLTAAIVTIGSYYAWIGLCKTATAAWNIVTKATIALHGTFRVAMMLGKIALMAMTGQVTKARHAFQLLNTVIKSNPFGLILSVLATVAVAISNLVGKVDEYTKAMNDAMKMANGLTEESIKEERELGKLIGTMEGATKGSSEYEKAKSAIIKQYGQYLQGLIDERGEINNLEEAYRRLTFAIRQTAKARGIQAARGAINTEYFQDVQAQLEALRQSLIDFGADARTASKIVSATAEQVTTGKPISKEIQDLLTYYQGQASMRHLTDRENTPVAIFNTITGRMEDYNARMQNLDEMEAATRPAKNANVLTLKAAITLLERLIESQEDGGVVSVIGSDGFAVPQYMTKDDARQLLDMYIWEQGQRVSPQSDVPSVDGGSGGNGGYQSQKQLDKERKQAEKDARKAAMEAKRELAKANAAYKAAMERAKGDWESDSADNVIAYATGGRTYEDYIAEKERLDLKYVEDRINIYNNLYQDETKENKALLLKYDEDYQALLLKKAELEKKFADARAKANIDKLQRELKEEQDAYQLLFNNPDSDFYGDSYAQQEALHQLRIKYLTKFRDQYKQGSKEYLQYERQIEDENAADILAKRKSYIEKLEEWRKDYSYLTLTKRRDLEIRVLDELHQRGLVKEEEYQRILAQIRQKYNAEVFSSEDGKIDYRSSDDQITAKRQSQAAEKQKELDRIESLYGQGLMSEEQYHQARRNVAKYYSDLMFEDIRNGLDEQTRMLFDLGLAWQNLFAGIAENGRIGFENIGEIAQATFAAMSAGLEMYGQFAAAQSRIEIANVQKRYDKEIEFAQGNSYKVARLEKKKEEETARLKKEATRKEFNIKVITAVAQTAQNALAAYGAGLQAGFPMALWLAPTLAGLATANGLMQVALLKKQQQAAEAEGYAEGGFTKKGPKYEPAGVVHAGEWVASQKLLANPVARPLIDALDYAQRTNTYGSLKGDDVSRSLTAPVTIARLTEGDASSAALIAAVLNSAEVMSRLSDRLDEPFVTVNTVSGDHGIKQAQDDYDKLINNITPKSKRKK